MRVSLDHVVIGCDRLERGLADLHDALGVTIPPGGKHPLMSTHNRIAPTGNGSYLELISRDPDAPAPGRSRWFSLDDPATQMTLPDRPRPLTWVVQTDDIEAMAARSPVDLGEIIQMTRQNLSWRVTVPKDGHLPEKGLLPVIIQWDESEHPSARFLDLGVELQSIRLSHPRPEELRHDLKLMGVDHLAEVSGGAPGMAFALETPQGLVELA
jgi:hypothetical protein